MSSYEHKTIFEDLSAELFFEIFDYFNFIELYYAFSNLNQRIDNYLAQLSNIYINICSWKQRELMTKLNEKQILCVRSIKFNIWRGDQHKIKEFFIQYEMKFFEQLRSLTLKSITTTDEFLLIINQLPLLSNLTFLDIKFDLLGSDLISSDLQYVYETIVRFCSTLNTLQFTIMDDLGPRKRRHNKPLFILPITSNIQHLKISNLYIHEFDHILSPSILLQVKSFTTSIYDYPSEKTFPNKELTLNSLTNLRLHFHQETTFAYLESVLQRTLNLKILVIASSPVTLIDCEKWQYFASKYLQKLVKFHLHARDHEQRQWSETKAYTDFQTSRYWITDRGGIVHTECKQVWDREDNDIGSISITFTTMPYQSWKGKCYYC